MTDSIRIDSRFHGPSCSGNGGYSCGLIARHIQGSSAVRLRIPPPLETDMDLRSESDGLNLYDGDNLVASAVLKTVDVTVPESPGFAAAELASQRYRGFESHFYPGCFVCGPERQHGDGLRIFAGPLNSKDGPQDMVAATWIPDNSLADDSGFIAAEFIWASLDCPGAYSFPEPEKGAILLGELAVDIRKPVSAGEKCVLIGWEINRSGRKHFTGTALFGATGDCYAVGYATWFEVPTQPAP